MGSIIRGLVLIAIGFAIGDSVFQGHITVTGVIFDGLGLFFIGRGAWSLYQQRAQA